MAQNDKFIVVIRDTRYVLSKSQIEFDSPNYFTKYFSDDTPEAEPPILELSRDPHLFRIVLDYLSGYSVFPLTEKHIPAYSSSQAVLQDLVADASFYELGGLLRHCQDQNHPREPTPVDETPPPRPTYLALTSVQVIDSKYVDEGELFSRYPFLHALDSHSPVPIPEQKLSDPAFSGLMTPENCTKFTDYRVLGAVNVVVSSRAPNPETWKLIGWKLSKNGTKCEIVVVLESRVEEKSLVNGVANTRYACQRNGGKSSLLSVSSMQK